MGFGSHKNIKALDLRPTLKSSFRLPTSSQMAYSSLPDYGPRMSSVPCKNLAPKSGKIGIFLPVPEEIDEIFDCLTGNDLTVVKLADLSILQSSKLPEYDALILPISAWPRGPPSPPSRPRNPGRGWSGPHSHLLLPPATPILSMVNPDEIGENVSFIRYPARGAPLPLPAQGHPPATPNRPRPALSPQGT